MLGPILVHHRKLFSSYNYFASTLVSLKPELRNILAFGTDGEVELYKAFAAQFPNAIHLRCFRHYRANIKTKLNELDISSDKVDCFLEDIFGKSNEGIHNEGLVDCLDEDDFMGRLNALESIWNERELSCISGAKPTFYTWFKSYKSQEIIDSMLRSVRESAGLGCPPSPYYTNNSECINSVMHNKTNYKASEWDKFNESMHELVKQSSQITEMAVIGRGAYRFCERYKEFEIDQLTWIRMTSKQREFHLKRVATVAPVGPLGHLSLLQHSITESPLSISFEAACAYTDNIPKETFQGIYIKAGELLNTTNAVVSGPCSLSSATQTVVVASKSSVKPRIISRTSKGKFSCEASCPNWASSRICSHVVAAAQFSSELEDFLSNCNKKKRPPNLSSLSKVGLPGGAGKKGNKPPRKRKCPEVIHTFASSAAPTVSSDSIATSNVFSPGHLTTSTQTSVSSSTTMSSSSSYTLNPSTPLFSQSQSMHSAYQHQQGWYHGPLPSASQWSHHAPVTQYQHISFHHECLPRNTFMHPANSDSNPNPFFLRFICGNIRICQSCRCSLRLQDGSVGRAPHDLCIGRLGKRQYYNNVTGSWCTPSKDTNSHFCARINCVRLASPTFVSSSLLISDEVRYQLTQTHKTYLLMEFEIEI
jgi:hypothetical protein